MYLCIERKGLMSVKIWAWAVVVIFAGLLAGCGDKKAKVDEKKAPPPPAAPEPPKGLGVSQKELLKGIDGITLEQLEGKSPVGGNVYKGGTGDGAAKATNMIVYGTPEVVMGVYANFAMGDNADADFAKRNAKFQEALLTNLFGKVPPDVASGLEWAKANAEKPKTVEVNGKLVKITYGADKSLSIDVR
jgi:hypothetical protein